MTQIGHIRLVAFHRFGGDFVRKFLFNFVFSALIVTSISVPAAFAQDDPAVDDVLFDAAERLKET